MRIRSIYFVYLMAVVLLILFFVECRKKPSIDFYAEKIFIELESMEVRVTGEYFFENFMQATKIVKFFYPFPVDSVHSYPSIILLDLSYEKDTNGIIFEMRMKPGKDNSFRITYQQKLRKRQFRYITTTTRNWKRPIKNAEFIIVANKSAKLKTNYQINKMEFYRDKQYCRIIKKEFFPGEDLIIEW
ncbi:MAG: hypothetical protein ACUVQ3_01750 [bacterium]